MRDLPVTPIDHRRARWVAIGLGLATLGALAAAIATLGPVPDRNVARPAGRETQRIATLLRCQRLGDAALADAGCRRAGAEHRQRFLAREARP